MEFTIREMTLQDYDAVYALWSETEGIGLSSADTSERIAAFLQRNPGMSFVAHVQGQLVGALLGGTDGRRGYLHHLAVRPQWRGAGIGYQLVARALAALKQAGVDRCHIFVYADNEAGKAFWKKVGWYERTELMLMSYDLT